MKICVFFEIERSILFGRKTTEKYEKIQILYSLCTLWCIKIVLLLFTRAVYITEFETGRQKQPIPTLFLLFLTSIDNMCKFAWGKRV